MNHTRKVKGVIVRRAEKKSAEVELCVQMGEELCCTDGLLSGERSFLLFSSVWCRFRKNSYVEFRTVVFL